MDLFYYFIFSIRNGEICNKGLEQQQLSMCSEVGKIKPIALLCKLQIKQNSAISLTKLVTRYPIVNLGDTLLV